MKNNLHTLAFYNVENLFDTIDDVLTNDDDFLPEGRMRWTNKRYANKLGKIARTIKDIGFDETARVPVLVGLAEVENERVLNDLLNHEELAGISYNFVHYEGPDERGMDVGLIYHEDYFTYNYSEVVPLSIYDEDGSRDYTRDALYVNGVLIKEEVHIIITHWPSRREGLEESAVKRREVARQLNEFLSSQEQISDASKIVIMGDFNDNPNDDNVEKHLVEVNPYLYNPFEKLIHLNRGSLNHRGDWYLFDQIIISHNFMKVESGAHYFKEANIFDDHMLKHWNGHEKGEPFRTYKGSKYLGGYSDHFPVYIVLMLRN